MLEMIDRRGFDPSFNSPVSSRTSSPGLVNLVNAAFSVSPVCSGFAAPPSKNK